MPPTTPQNQPNNVPPATLPGLAMPPASQDGMPGGSQGAMPQMPMQAAPQTTEVSPSQEVTDKAKQLVEAYGQDPFQLATLFADLKADYLAREHHISPNAAGN